jgi:malate dehydrogenase
MPKDKDFKKLVRTRVAKTGESYSAARAQLVRRPPTRSQPPVVCAIVGAGGRVAYNMVFRLASGEVFGPDVPVILRLIDLPEALPALEGTVFELEDCSYPLLAGIDATSDYAAGFSDAAWILMLGSPRRTAGMERADLLAATAASFTSQGQAVAQAASPDVRILVVGNPANTNCLIARSAAPDVPEDRWFAMLRLDHNRTRSRLADRAEVSLNEVGCVAVWGNHSATMVPDVWHANIEGRPAVEHAAIDDDWITSDLVPAVQQRGAQLIEVSGASSAASAAAALTDSMHDLLHGTADGDWTTIGMTSRGEYGIPPGLQFGFPVTVSDGVPQVVGSLPISDVQQVMIDRTTEELVAERDLALDLASRSAFEV